MTPAPFTAKMDVDQYLNMVQAVRETGRALPECYEICEAIHERFCNGPRFTSPDSMRQAYYDRHPAKAHGVEPKK